LSKNKEDFSVSIKKEMRLVFKNTLDGMDKGGKMRGKLRQMLIFRK
jgi:hypothetical protein